MSDRLQNFCATEKVRYDFQSPFVIDGFRIACNGKVMAFERTRDPNTTGNYPPKIILLVKEIAAAAPSTPFDPIDKAALCKRCVGVGHYKGRCPTCRGMGEYTCDHCGSHVICDECEDGRGWIDCAECKGEATRVDVLGQHFAAEYLLKIQSLPGKVLVALRDGNDHGERELIFHWENGGGMLMPMVGGEGKVLQRKAVQP